MYDAIAEHKVTHLCGAPIVMATLLNAPADEKKPLPHVVEFFTAAAPPPEAVLAAMKEAGFNVTHVYGLTETYGPAVVNEWHDDWDALAARRAGRQESAPGRALSRARSARRARSRTPCSRCRATARRMGEVMFRGNVVMKGYLKNKTATEKAFAGGWFHSGDLGVMHPDGYIQLKDRSKDIIISGGENISSIEVEDALYKHPAVQAAAVVAKPDDKWGETPCAFVELKPGKSATADELVAWCRKQSRGLQVPALRGVRRTAEDHDRQDSEIQAARDGEGGVRKMADRFANYEELCKIYQKPRDFDIRIKDTRSCAAIIAPHGGKIEPATSEIAEEVASDTYKLYCFNGHVSKNNRSLHITSHNFDEPECLKLITECEIVLAIHGRRDGKGQKDVYLGGLDVPLVRSIANNLDAAQFSSKCDGHKFPAIHVRNICNRGRTRRGAQLELPYTLRMKLIDDPARLGEFSRAVRAAINEHR